MKKRVVSLLLMFTIIFSLIGCQASDEKKKEEKEENQVNLSEFDYEKELKDGHEKIVNSKKIDFDISYKVSETIGNDINDLLDEIAKVSGEDYKKEINENKLTEEEIDIMNSILGQYSIFLGFKADISSSENFKMEMTPKLVYKDNDFFSGKLYSDRNKIYVNESNLLNQPVLVKLDFINQMMSQSGMDLNTILEESFEYAENNTEISLKFNEMLMNEITGIIGEPELQNVSIKNNGKDMNVVEVKYQSSYADLVKAAKVILENDDILAQYKKIMMSQFDFANDLTSSLSGSQVSEEEFEKEVDEMLNKIKTNGIEGLNEIQANEDLMEFLSTQNLSISYYLNDGIKKCIIDFKYFSGEVSYNSIGDDVKFTEISEEDSYVIADQLSAMGITSVLNQEKLTELSSSELVIDFKMLVEMLDNKYPSMNIYE